MSDVISLTVLLLRVFGVCPNSAPTWIVTSGNTLLIRDIMEEDLNINDEDLPPISA